MLQISSFDYWENVVAATDGMSQCPETEQFATRMQVKRRYEQITRTGEIQ